MRVALLALLLLMPAAQAAAPARLDHGRFENVQLLLPATPAQSVVLLLSDTRGWQPAEQLQALALQRAGAAVIGIDTAQFMRALEADGGDCVYPDGDLENLSRFLQAYAQLPGYRAPLLAGNGVGAALAYATLMQAPTGTFAAGLLSDFEARLPLQKPLCTSPNAQATTPATKQAAVLLGQRALASPVLILNSRAAPALDALLRSTPAARQLRLAEVGGPVAGSPAGRIALTAAVGVLAKQAASVAPPIAADLGDLPVIEEPAAGNSPFLAVFWSGDGGWAGIDKEVSDALNARGVPVVGVDSLRYFWKARTPEGVAADIETISRHYLRAWGKQKLLLIGYSQGADVLPFAVNRLGAGLRKQVALVAAMGLSDHAVFEFQLGNWVADNNDGPETLPEVLRIQGLPFLCLYGAEEDDSICPRLPAGGSAKAVKMAGGHHFDGDYAGLATVILEALPKP